MAKFKVGDRVISIEPVGNKGVKGVIGRVMYASSYDCLVEFDRDIGGHDGNLNYPCIDGRGWFCEFSEIELVKENNMFTKKDLKNGDVVKFRSRIIGAIGIAIPDINTIIFKEGQMNMDLLTDDMLYIPNHDYDIVAIRRPDKYDDCSFSAFNHKYDNGTLVYERKEVEEMTLEEVCKVLGKEIKIVKK